MIELASDARFAKDLAAGGVFVPARGFQVLDEIDLVVRGSAGELCLHARVVYIDPANGCGLELVGFGSEIKERLAQLASTPAEAAAVAGTKTRRQRVLTTRPGQKRSPDARDVAMIELDDLGDIGGVIADDPGDDGTADAEPDDGECGAAFGGPASDRDDARERELDGERGGELDSALAYQSGRDGALDEELDCERRDERDSELVANDRAARAPRLDGEGTLEPDGQRAPLNAIDRLRGLSLAEQLKVARGPSASERMALERMYGKNVWDALLHNPGLSTPEVARLSRLGTLPRVLLELIVNNNTWLQVPEVRRALLGNPRLGTDQIARVLRLLPKHELKLASTIPAYPAAVRSMAKKMIKDSP